MAPAHNPCILVPVYNHPDGIQNVCAKLANHTVPCLLVDDGSDSHCQAILQQLAANHEWIHLLRLEKNSGKGAAVTAGLHWCYEQGFTHALQVDADGQHDLDDVPLFLQRSLEHPLAVVTGTRVADGISAARHYGRKLTDWLVWLQTLSTTIEDSMCGYRVYPLPATVDLLRRHTVGQRMDFDSDILVRLTWRNVAVEQVTTRVIYREGIPSHFRMFWDNLRLVRMHTLLVLGMLVRSPVLILRKCKSAH
ncbi:MAG: glycosyltransferase family 2 protein [Halioglobus sp.]